LVSAVIFLIPVSKQYEFCKGVFVSNRYEESQIQILLDVDGEVDDDDREYAVSALADIQPRPSRKAIDVLVHTILTDPEESVRSFALHALLRVASQPQNRQRPKHSGKLAFDLSLTAEIVVLAATLDKSGRVRADAVSLSEAAGGKNFARTVAKNAMRDDSQEVRTSATTVLRGSAS
jgi:HEAT repeat protein